MDIEQATPPNMKNSAAFWINSTRQCKSDNSCSSGSISTAATPSKKNYIQNHMKQPRTPPNSSSESSAISFGSFQTSTASTPPAKRFQRVRNPFEPVLAERLQLPLIASPSLFQRPAAPPLSSTQFEWTIDEVSSLKPANVEAHETQFHDSPDPEFEAMAQSAISSFFKEQKIVPSPVDCPLRYHRIILSEINGNTPITKSGRRIRDCGTQTELTLPVILPKALEDALRPYFQPQLAIDDYIEACKSERLQSVQKSPGNGVDAKDVSLRRKLFDMHNIIIFDNDQNSTAQSMKQMKSSPTAGSQTNSSPLSVASLQRTTIAGHLSSDSHDKSSFDSFSPISTNDGHSISPASRHGSATKHKENMHDLFNETQLSPILPPARSGRRKSLKNSINAVVLHTMYRNKNENDQTYCGMASLTESNVGKFTPDRSSSPLGCLEKAELCSDSFNLKVSRLKVNSTNCTTSGQSRLLPFNPTIEPELFSNDDTDEIVDNDDEDMMISQLSTHSSNCSMSSDTPRSKRRTANRKNLSQSFSTNWLDEDDDTNAQVPKINLPQLNDCLATAAATAAATVNTEEKLSVIKESAYKGPPAANGEQRSTFYRTDSGFNEMTTNSSSMASLQQEENSHDAAAAAFTADHHIKLIDHFATFAATKTTTLSTVTTEQLEVNMVCCSSTPSKHKNF